MKKLISDYYYKEVDKETFNIFFRKLRDEVFADSVVLNYHQYLTDDEKIKMNDLYDLMKSMQSFYFFIYHINNQWRIIFQWKNNDAYEVKIIDYH